MRSNLLAKLWALQMVLALLLLIGCSSVVENNEPFAVIIAKQEAQRRGWKHIEVEGYSFRDGFWWVYVYRRPLKIAGNDAWVKISPDGTVLDFSINTR